MKKEIKELGQEMKDLWKALLRFSLYFSIASVVTMLVILCMKYNGC